ncbi:hypothetical protein HPG69_018367 [Diceros bicornis minor]|uniref:Uncharacterized protein n=1 Tax=Diceros bicornis minor TaxID=77932 RepID=A0A7J7F3L3_DICBM|nr:hypothetical protein HPG69_018367 [Diceros bicornis minor]
MDARRPHLAPARWTLRWPWEPDCWKTAHRALDSRVGRPEHNRPFTACLSLSVSLFSVLMSFTHFLFKEKKSNCLVAYIFSEEFWGVLWQNSYSEMDKENCGVFISFLIKKGKRKCILEPEI